jgi:broad specificity phosphatase PhoE/cation transport regulator ChaB
MLTFAQAIEFQKAKSHAKVDYRDTPNGDQQCSGCSMFRPPSDCTAVAPPIVPGGWCKLFERRDANAAVREQLGKGQPGAADVHVATALGNEDKAKAKDFLTTIAEIKGGARVVQLPASVAVGKSDKKDGLVTLHIVRHGATKMNNETDTSQDRIRGWTDVPLTDEGREEAVKAAGKLKKYGIQVIVHSDLSRATETAKIIGKELGIKPISSPKLRPWDLGKFSGMSTKDAMPQIEKYVRNEPDEPVPEGESFNDFRNRAFQGIKDAFKKAGGKTLAIVTHHRNERLMTAWDKVGQPADHTIDLNEFAKKGDPPGGVVEIDIDLKALDGKGVDPDVAVADDGKDDVDKVWASNADLPANVQNLPSEAQTVFRRVANDRIKAGADEVSAIRQAWTAVKNGWEKKGDKWVRKADLLALMEKNAPPSLKMMDGDMAHSPFPHDANALANLRPDQVPRFLGALTDPDAGGVKTVRMSSLVAMQDRVDPAKVQSMRDAEPDKLPLVVRNGGRNIIADGHHRLAAHHMNGRKTAQVRFMDLTPVDNAVKRHIDLTVEGGTDADWEIPLDIIKADADRQLVFGWASISSVGGEMVVDKQEDIIPEDELETAAYDFVLYHRQQGDMHDRMGVGRLVESMMFTKQKQDALGIDLGLVGWFVGFKVDDAGVWKRIKEGDLPEFSIGGKATRESVEN